MTNEVNPRETVVITGASAGVGRAVAREFGRNRARIGLIARGHDGLEAARHKIEAGGGEALTIVADVSQPEQLEHAATVVEEKFGPIEIWINDAMASVFSPVAQMFRGMRPLAVSSRSARRANATPPGAGQSEDQA